MPNKITGQSACLLLNVATILDQNSGFLFSLKYYCFKKKKKAMMLSSFSNKTLQKLHK
jgi:hypothetical protein